uniref:Uncharacterized protein n=1 Tax=viral metagenome TaxID=1070528 RepID=A0A6C0JXE6_9ZZZZ
MRRDVRTKYVVVAFKETKDERLSVTFTGGRDSNVTFLGSYFLGDVYRRAHAPGGRCLHRKPCRRASNLRRPRNPCYFSDDSETSDSEEGSRVHEPNDITLVPDEVWRHVYDSLQSRSGTSKYYAYKLEQIFWPCQETTEEVPDLVLTGESAVEIDYSESIRHVKVESFDALIALRSLDLPNLVKLSLGRSMSLTKEVIGQLTPYSYCEIELPSTTRDKDKILKTGTETLSISGCKEVEGYEGFRSYRYTMESNLFHPSSTLYLDMNRLGPKVVDVTILDDFGQKIEIVSALKSGKSARTCL